jgi:type IV secretory pathway TraG/TraD family ATPase VirD4
MRPVLRWLDATEETERELRQRLASHPDALEELERVWALGARFLDSILLTARTALRVYKDDEVMSTSLGSGPGGKTRITFDSVLGTAGGRGATLYIVSPTRGWRYFAPMFTALLDSLIERAFSLASSGPLDPPLLLALDEVANITPIRDLPAIASTAAGSGIQLLTALHDLSQADGIWHERARSLVTNHYARLVMGGTGDGATLEWARTMIGEVDVEVVEKGGPPFASKTVGRRTERRPRMTAAEIRTMPRGTALLICGPYPAARVTLNEWTTI